MSKEFWDQRFSEQEYVYGKEPNLFYKEQIDRLPKGKILLPGDGEGRNSVYAASIGWDADALDFSTSARIKAHQLANEKNVKINYSLSNFMQYSYPENYYDAVGLVFIHLTKAERKFVFSSCVRSLKKNGRIILEAFNKNQLGNSSGGPQDVQLLYSKEELIESFASLDIKLLEYQSVLLNEGAHHEGKAEVIRFIGVKK